MPTLFLADYLATDAREAGTVLRNRSKAATKEVLGSVEMEDIANSARFDVVMKSFPNLKEKFIIAASRDKVLKTERPAPPRRLPGFNM